MLVDFKGLANSSKIWIFQSNRELAKNEVEEISDKLKAFVQSWKRHGDDLKASYLIKYDQFIILAVDEEYNGVSGCSIDAATHLFKQFENSFKIDLFNKLNVAFKDGEIINVVSLADFQKYVNEGKINTNTIVFNNLIDTKEKLENEWEVPASVSWHNRYF